MTSFLESMTVARGIFTCMVQPPAPSTAGDEGVVVMHGLGEDRSGHNYVWSQLASKLNALGLTVYRFDLAGMGDSLLPLDVEIWAAQLDAVRRSARRHRRLHLVMRGAARAAAPDEWPDGSVVAVRPCGADEVGACLDDLLGQATFGQIRPRQGALSVGEQRFWTALGVEVRAIGGLSVAASFMCQLAVRATACPANWTVVAAGHDADRAAAGTVLLEGADSLFLHAEDRRRLNDLIAKRLISGSAA